MEERMWDQQNDEPLDAYSKFVVYLGLGPSRSLTEAYRQTARVKKTTANVHISPQFSKLAQDYHWLERAKAHDRYLNDLQLREIEEKAMNSGYALRFNRIIALDKMAERLEKATESGRLFVKKRIAGATFEELDAPLVKEWRGLLDDLAKETGGRSKMMELSGPNGGPLQIDVQVFKPEPEPDDDYEELEDGQW